MGKADGDMVARLWSIGRIVDGRRVKGRLDEEGVVKGLEEMGNGGMSELSLWGLT